MLNIGVKIGIIYVYLYNTYIGGCVSIHCTASQLRKEKKTIHRMPFKYEFFGSLGSLLAARIYRVGIKGCVTARDMYNM